MSKDLFKQSSLQKLFDGLDRGGVRGGRDQFKWDDVKTDKDRSYYLANSLMAVCCLFDLLDNLACWTMGKRKRFDMVYKIR